MAENEIGTVIVDGALAGRIFDTLVLIILPRRRSTPLVGTFCAPGAG
jgi:hypothetical protein